MTTCSSDDLCPDDHGTVTDCVFCEILAGRAPATFVQRAPKWSAFVPLGPAAPGHVLFVPARHVASAAEAPAVAGAIMRVAAGWAASRYPAYNLITSSGADATQSVFHLHVHVVPRGPGDGLPVHWPWLNLGDRA